MSHSPAPLKAIVTDGLWRKSLSAIRSLGKEGFEVSVMGDSLFTTGFWSRYARSRIRAPLASADPDGFGRALTETLSRNPGAVVLPMEDPSLNWISDHREELEQVGTFLLPPKESLAIAQDKARTMREAQAIGIPCPRTWEPESAEAFASLALNLEPGTFITKPRTGTGSAGITYGDPRAENQWKEHWNAHGPMLIQERVPAQGQGRGVSLLMGRDGECLAAFAHERLSQYPVSGGPSTDRHGIWAPGLVDQSVRFLKHLRWQGIAMVEWKVDPRDGREKLMEINPRFWGSLELAVRSGVDFPALYAKAALGESVEPVLSYRTGVRCRWMMPGEILRFVSTPPRERESVFAFLKGLPSSAEEWDLSDLSGAMATAVCTGALALNPRYWKYVRRG